MYVGCISSPFLFFYRLLKINNKYSAEVSKDGEENSKNKESDAKKEVRVA